MEKKNNGGPNTSSKEKDSEADELAEAGVAYTMLFKHSPLPQAIMTMTGRYLDVNDSYCKLHGFTLDEFLGHTPADVGIAVEEEFAKIAEIFEASDRKLDGLLLKYPIRNGSLLYARIFAHEVRMNGEACVLIVLDDITQQRLAEKAAKESERLLHTILDSIPTRVFWKDKNSVLLGCNKLVANDFGHDSPEALIGKTDYDFFDKKHADQFIRDDKKVMQEDRPHFNFEEQQPQSDGSLHWLLTSKVPLKDGNGKLIGILGTYDDITERKHAEAELKLARFSIDHALSSIIWISKSGCIVDFNPALSDLLQYTREELLSRSIPDIDPNYTATRWPHHWEELRTKGALSFTTKLIRKDQKILDVEVHAHFLEFEGMEYNCAFVQDITERKIIEDKLQQSLHFQEAVLNNIPAGVFWKDTQSRYLGGNAAFRNITHYQNGESLLGKPDEEFPWADQAERLRKDDREVMENNISKLNYVEPLRNADGKVHYNEVSKVPLVNADGRVIGVLGTFQDITEKIEAEQALRKNEKLLKGVVQNVSAIIYMLDTEGIFQLSEGLALSVLGLKPGQVIGMSVFDMYKDFPEITSDISKALKGELVENEITIGGLTFFSRFTPLTDDAGVTTGILCVSFDITARKKMEEELNALNNELEQRVTIRTEQLQQANQDLEAFAYSVSHDLRAPIRHIDGFSKLMYNAVENPSETVSRHYQRITESSKRMAHMVDDLLSFSRLGKKPIATTTVDLDSTINTVVSNFKNDLHNRIIEWNVQPIGKVKGDPNLLQLAFENLLSNALKYSSVRDVTIIKISSTRTDNHLEIAISDNGVGFDMAYADKLFGVFQRLHSNEEFEGTGIGLANVRQIMLKHNGSVRAEGKLNEGATFYITFPLN